MSWKHVQYEKQRINKIKNKIETMLVKWNLSSFMMEPDPGESH